MDNQMDSQKAEEVLIEATGIEGIKDLVVAAIDAWELQECSDVICKIKSSHYALHNDLFAEEQNETVEEALQILVFERVHDLFFPDIKDLYCSEDFCFYEKCKLFCKWNISAEQFGADENYTIPLTAAIVELSVIDKYKSPIEKMNCLYSSYDLVFAEIKTAMVAVISQNSEKDNDIPIINNSEIIPVLMMVIIKSKLAHMLSNLFYIKSLYLKLEENHLIFGIFKSFETAVNKLMDVDAVNLNPIRTKVMHSIDLEQYMKITSTPEEEVPNRTLVDEVNQRSLNLITRSTGDLY